MPIYLGVNAVVAFGLAVGLGIAAYPPAAVAHAAFALGAMPLIFAAMAHFVPVLTRSGSAEAWIHRLTWWMAAAGGLVVAVLAGALPGGLLHAALLVGVGSSAAMLRWAWRRGQRCLGQPHPGLAWYWASLGCLLAALLAMLTGLLWPAAYAVLRSAHLHLNTLGFIGLAALGTLHVLMPTVLGQPDPKAALRLRRQLRWALAGVALTALSAAQIWLAPLGALLLAGVVVDTLLAWLRLHGLARLLKDGAAVALLVATLGLLVTLGSGVAHAFGWGAGRGTVSLFLVVFVLPLVTGALSQLVPVWRFAGPASPARAALRARLVRFGTLRSALFVLGGVLLMLGWDAGWLLVAAGVALFALPLLGGLLAPR